MRQLAILAALVLTACTEPDPYAEGADFAAADGCAATSDATEVDASVSALVGPVLRGGRVQVRGTDGRFKSFLGSGSRKK